MREPPLTPTAIRAGLRTVALPQSIHCFDTIPSTMEPARELLTSSADDVLPLLVTAEEQTAGRGRSGRRWHAPHGSALLCSLALRPTWLPPDRTVALVWMLAVALCEAIPVVSELKAGLKWPNDLLLPSPGGYAKAAGMLIEVTHGSAGVTGAILGCGVNVHAAPPPGSTPYPATSVSGAAGRHVDRLSLLQAWLTRLDYWYLQVRQGQYNALHTAWIAHLVGIGKPIKVNTSDGALHGVFMGVNSSGSLLLRGDDGNVRTITNGDVGMV